jgi:hypothetical protein
VSALQQKGAKDGFLDRSSVLSYFPARLWLAIIRVLEFDSNSRRAPGVAATGMSLE